MERPEKENNDPGPSSPPANQVSSPPIPPPSFYGGGVEAYEAAWEYGETTAIDLGALFSSQASTNTLNTIGSELIHPLTRYYQSESNQRIPKPSSTDTLPIEAAFVNLTLAYEKKSQSTEENKTHAIIFGEAGVGKSIASQWMAYCWSRKVNPLWGGPQGRFQAVFWLRLKDLLVQPPLEKFSAVLLACCMPGTGLNQDELYVKNLTAWLLAHKNQVLFILDGYDEIAEAASDPDTRLKQFLDEVLDYSFVIITSRSYRYAKIGQNSIEFFTHYRNIGFHAKDFPRYLHAYFDGHKKKTSLVIDIISWLENHPIAKSIAHVPLQLGMIAWLWQSVDQKELENMPDSLTLSGLYQRIVDHKLLELNRRLSKLNKTQLKSIRFSEVSTLIENFLSQLAYQDINNTNKAKRYRFSMEQVHSIIKRLLPPSISREEFFFGCVLPLGFLRSEKGSVNFQQMDYFYFSHLTYEEFYCARGIITLFSRIREDKSYEQKIIELISGKKYNQHYVRVWWFVAGLLGDSWKRLKKELPRNILNIRATRDKEQASRFQLEIFFNELQRNLRDIVGGYELGLLVRCVEEAQLGDDILTIAPGILNRIQHAFEILIKCVEVLPSIPPDTIKHIPFLLQLNISPAFHDKIDIFSIDMLAAFNNNVVAHGVEYLQDMLVKIKLTSKNHSLIYKAILCLKKSKLTKLQEEQVFNVSLNYLKYKFYSREYFPTEIFSEIFSSISFDQHRQKKFFELLNELFSIKNILYSFPELLHIFKPTLLMLDVPYRVNISDIILSKLDENQENIHKLICFASNLPRQYQVRNYENLLSWFHKNKRKNWSHGELYTPFCLIKILPLLSKSQKDLLFEILLKIARTQDDYFPRYLSEMFIGLIKTLVDILPEMGCMHCGASHVLVLDLEKNLKRFYFKVSPFDFYGDTIKALSMLVSGSRCGGNSLKRRSNISEKNMIQLVVIIKNIFLKLRREKFFFHEKRQQEPAILECISQLILYFPVKKQEDIVSFFFHKKNNYLRDYHPFIKILVKVPPYIFNVAQAGALKERVSALKKNERGFFRDFDRSQLLVKGLNQFIHLATMQEQKLLVAVLFQVRRNDLKNDTRVEYLGYKRKIHTYNHRLIFSIEPDIILTRLGFLLSESQLEILIQRILEHFNFGSFGYLYRRVTEPGIAISLLKKLLPTLIRSQQRVIVKALLSLMHVVISPYRLYSGEVFKLLEQYSPLLLREERAQLFESMLLVLSHSVSLERYHFYIEPNLIEEVISSGLSSTDPVRVEFCQSTVLWLAHQDACVRFVVAQLIMKNYDAYKASSSCHYLIFLLGGLSHKEVQNNSLITLKYLSGLLELILLASHLPELTERLCFLVIYLCFFHQLALTIESRHDGSACLKTYHKEKSEIIALNPKEIYIALSALRKVYNSSVDDNLKSKIFPEASMLMRNQRLWGLFRISENLSTDGNSFLSLVSSGKEVKISRDQWVVAVGAYKFKGILNSHAFLLIEGMDEYGRGLFLRYDLAIFKDKKTDKIRYTVIVKKALYLESLQERQNSLTNEVLKGKEKRFVSCQAKRKIDVAKLVKLVEADVGKNMTELYDSLPNTFPDLFSQVQSGKMKQRKMNCLTWVLKHLKAALGDDKFKKEFGELEKGLPIPMQRVKVHNKSIFTSLRRLQKGGV